MKPCPSYLGHCLPSSHCSSQFGLKQVCSMDLEKVIVPPLPGLNWGRCFTITFSSFPPLLDVFQMMLRPGCFQCHPNSWSAVIPHTYPLPSHPLLLDHFSLKPGILSLPVLSPHCSFPPISPSFLPRVEILAARAVSLLVRISGRRRLLPGLDLFLTFSLPSRQPKHLWM